MPTDEDSCYQAIPEVLLKQGKVKNPYPNVDAHSFLVKALRFVFLLMVPCDSIFWGIVSDQISHPP